MEDVDGFGYGFLYYNNKDLMLCKYKHKDSILDGWEILKIEDVGVYKYLSPSIIQPIVYVVKYLENKNHIYEFKNVNGFVNNFNNIIKFGSISEAVKNQGFIVSTYNTILKLIEEGNIDENS